MSWLLLLRSNWKLLGLGLLCLALAVQTVRLAHRSNQLERAKINLNECRQGRIDDRKAYEDAQAKAAELNKQEVNRIVGEQDRISNDIESDLRARLERLRSELRKGTAPDQGSSGKPGTPGVPQSGEGTPSPSRVCYAPEVVLRAAENEERHEQLIRWVQEQLKVVR